MRKRLLPFLLLILAFWFKGYAQAPVITSFSPATGPAGITITITGQWFNSTAANNVVYVGPVKAAVNSATPTKITFTVPAGASYGPVSVFNSDNGLTAYSPRPFIPTFESKPTLTNLDFDAPVPLIAVKNVSGVNFADIDGDGKPDMIVLNNNIRPYATVYRNLSATGSINMSSFGPGVNFATGGEPGPILVKDINGDGKPDLIILNQYNDDFTVLMNNATPGTIDAQSFVGQEGTGVFSSPTDFDIADLDSDGKPDIIVTNNDPNFGISFSIFQNNSVGGTLALNGPFVYGTPRSCTAVCTGDIDGDGKPDVVFANTDNSISIYQNNSANGTIVLGSELNIPLGTRTVQAIKLADLNGDGKPDLILSYTNPGNIITVYRNISTKGTISAASFAAPVDLAISYGTYEEISVADINGDGKPDIILNDSPLSILINNSSGSQITFSAKADVLPGADANTVTFAANYVTVCDADGDGKPDIFFNDINDGQVWVLHNNPQPAVATVASPMVGSVSPAVAPNGSDITVSGTNFNGLASSNVVYMGAAKGKVLSATPSQLTVQVPPGTTYFPLSVVNTTTGLQASSVNPFISTFKSSGIIDTSVFKRAGYITTSFSPEASAIADLDGDGKPDVVFFNDPANQNTISISPNSSASTGSFTFKSLINYPTPFYALPYQPGEILLYDLDGDGKPDILFASQGPVGVTGFGALLNTSTLGNISFAPFKDFGASYNAYVAAGDLDGDGKIDIIVGSNSAGADETSTMQVFRNTSVAGKLSFASPIIFGTNGGGMIKVADIDGDGKPDIIVANSGTNTVTVFRNTSVGGGVAFIATPDIVTGSAPDWLRIADIDGDGKPDLVMTNVSGSKNISILRNTSTAGKVSFATHIELTDADQISEMTIGDVNGDGKADIVTVSGPGGITSVLQNKSSQGTVSFGQKVDFSPTPYPVFVSVGDLDADGKADLVVSFDVPSTYAAPYGIAIVKNNIQLVPVPTITANGPLTFLQGKNVILTANPDTGYTYQWYRNGAIMKDTTTASVTITTSGSYAVALTLEGDSKTSAPVTVDAMFKLPPDNFKITITSAPCRGSNDGSVNITAIENLNYTATITGNGLNSSYPFNSSTNINNLAAGTYSVCITVAGEANFQQCYDVVITEPADLSVYSTVNADNTITLALNGGAQYNITLNGNGYATTNSIITLALNSGNNELEVSTDKLCQGTIRKIINYSTEIVPYPVPFQATLNINLGNDPIAKTSIVINNATNGQIVFTHQYMNQSGVLHLDLSELKSGVYGLHLVMGSTEKVFKIMKQ